MNFLALTSPLRSTGIRAGGTFLTGVSECPGLRALTAAADAASPSAAHLSILRDAGRRLRGAVAVVADVASVALTLPTVTFAVT